MAGKTFVTMLIAVAMVSRAGAIGGLLRAEMSPLVSPMHHSMRPEERLQHAQMRLRHSSVAAGAWLTAKKEKILTEEEIYAEKVRKFARSVDQVSPSTLCGHPMLPSGWAAVLYIPRAVTTSHVQHLLVAQGLWISIAAELQQV